MAAPRFHALSESYIEPPDPIAVPLREPRLHAPSLHDLEAQPSTPKSDLKYAESSTSVASSVRQKHESYDLTGSVFLITKDGTTLKLPAPSESRFDPLNWGRWKTAGAMLALAWYSVFSLTVVQAASLLMNGLSVDFHEPDTRPFGLETLSTAPTLCMGLGAFLWVPLTLALGRRPVFVIASLIGLLATIGAAHAKTFHQLLCFVCFLGLGEGFSVSAVLLMAIDMTFIAQRPFVISAIWSAAGFAGAGLVSIVPYLSDHGQDWHLFYRLWSAPMGISLILAVLLYPETYFKRPTVAFDGLIVMQSATEKLTVYEDKEADSDLYRDLPSLDSPPRGGVAGIWDRLALRRSPFASWKAMGRCYLQIAFCAINPLIFWVLLASSANFAGMMFIGVTYAEILSSAPYNLPSYLVIIVTDSSAIGALLCLPLSFLVGKIIIKLSKLNRGVREAEHYLVGYILPVTTGALSTLLYGVAVEREWHFGWFYFAYGLNGFSWVGISITNTLWVTEAFPRWAAPALTVVGGGCYLISFTMSFALVPWIAAHGYQLVGIELGILQIALGLIAVPISFWGKKARQIIHGRWANERSGALRPL